MSDESSAKAPLDQVQANALLAEVEACPSLVNITKAANRLQEMREALGRVNVRMGFLSTFTFDPLRPAMELQALRAGVSLSPYLGGYGQFERELIDSASPLASFEPDVLLLALRLQDVCADIYDGFNALDQARIDRLLDDWFERLSAALTSFRSRSGAYILVQNYDLPAYPAAGIAEAKAAYSQTAVIGEANRRLNALADSMENVHVLDYDGLVARHGRVVWSDARTAYFARIPIASEHYWRLAGFYVRHLRPLFGLTKKVLVLDADHTLWGGTVGDVGPDGIELGHDYPGNAYVAFQRRILDLYHRGVVLALASKNQPEIIEKVLAEHPDMVLRSEHFAAKRVNWGPKPENVRDIAETLNLGVDSFVFVDDSPVECELMRAALPEVLTIQLPKDPAAYAGLIERLDCFDQWKISDEDRRRGQLYKAEAERSASRSTAIDLPTFYRRLQMKMTLFVDCEAHVARAAQMTNRTNQFNMHTIRCSEDDIRRCMASDDQEVITLALEDRFGDNGVIGMAIAQRDDDVCVLRMLLMSCRVLGRTVEQTFVGWLAERARAAGAGRLTAEFVATAKNKPFADFYERCGFSRSGSSGDIEHWTRDLATAETAAPDWMTILVGPTKK